VKGLDKVKETINGINIISEEDGIVLTDKKCKHCGIQMRYYEALDYKDTCEECSYKSK
jgi:hypothetical protein